jgi:hypothetical protein
MRLACERGGVVRAIDTFAGGFPTNHGTCLGHASAFLVAGTMDTGNPINNVQNGVDIGIAGARDAFLAANGCTGTTTAPWDPAYADCVAYSGCPASTPVIWCPRAEGHDSDMAYLGGGGWKFFSQFATVP